MAMQATNQRQALSLVGVFLALVVAGAAVVWTSIAAWDASAPVMRASHGITEEEMQGHVVNTAPPQRETAPAFTDDQLNQATPGGHPAAAGQ